MSSKTTASYVVYMPYGPKATCYPFELPENAYVKYLEMAIRSEWSYRQDLKYEEISLFKVKLSSPM